MDVEDRRAAIKRWVGARFGAPGFAALGLPGGEIIDAGLAALAAGQETVESLVVSLAAPRLRREGVPLPREVFPDADVRLYRLLEATSGGMAHARYLAYLRQASSFADACTSRPASPLQGGDSGVNKYYDDPADVRLPGRGES